MQQKDAELVQQIRNGDKAAFRELVARFADPLFGLAYALLGNRADAEDVVQESMLAALSAIHSFEGRSSVGTWLRSIVTFQAAKVRRSRKVRSALSLAQDEVAVARDRELQSASAATAVDSRVDAMAMLQTLSEEHRQVLVLRELQQLSYDQIAGVLKVPVGTVMSRLHRARQELRQRFEEYQA